MEFVTTMQLKYLFINLHSPSLYNYGKSISFAYETSNQLSIVQVLLITFQDHQGTEVSYSWVWGFPNIGYIIILSFFQNPERDFRICLPHHTTHVAKPIHQDVFHPTTEIGMEFLT